MKHNHSHQCSDCVFMIPFVCSGTYISPLVTSRQLNKIIPFRHHVCAENLVKKITAIGI